MTNANREFQIVDSAFRGGSPPPPVGPGGDQTALADANGEQNLTLCREFDAAYTRSYLKRGTVLWGTVAVLCGAVDVATMRHIIGLKFTDSFGNLTTSEGVVWFAAMLTLTVFLVISFLWAKGPRALKLAAAAVYLMLVVFLAMALWPTEAPTLRSVWSSAAPVAASFDTAELNDEAPMWFLIVGLCLLATVATMPGLMLIMAKSQLTWYAELWRVRGEAQSLLADAQANDSVSDGATTANAVGTYYANDSLRTDAVRRVVQRAVLAHEQEVRSRIEAAKAQLASPLAKTPRERDELTAHIQTGEGLIRQSAAINI